MAKIQWLKSWLYVLDMLYIESLLRNNFLKILKSFSLSFFTLCADVLSKRNVTKVIKRLKYECLNYFSNII